MSTRQSLEAFLAAKAEFDALLAELRHMSDDHFGVAPDAVTWGHVGSLAAWNRHIRQVTDAYFRRGEFAD